MTETSVTRPVNTAEASQYAWHGCKPARVSMHVHACVVGGDIESSMAVITSRVILNGLNIIYSHLSDNSGVVNNTM
jgi:hypothetical protein